MKKDIILAGVGGQGILTIASVIGMVAVNNDLYLKQAEVHGMSQRGGDVQSNLRISDTPIYSDLIAKGHADMILSVEPMEALRYLPFLKEDGVVVTNITPFNNITDYPVDEDLFGKINSLPRKVAINADKIAKDLGSARSMNIVMLGAATPFLGLKEEQVEQAIRDIFGRKGEEILEKNLQAFRAGLNFAKENI